MLPSVLSGVVLGLDLWKKRGVVLRGKGKGDGNGRVEVLKKNNMLVRCPNCKRGFQQAFSFVRF